MDGVNLAVMVNQKDYDKLHTVIVNGGKQICDNNLELKGRFGGKRVF